MNGKYFLRAVIFAILSALIVTPLQKLNSIFILKEQGPPDVSFLIPVGIIGFIMKTLFATAYILMGNKLPIRNSQLRDFTFIGLIWVSAYLPQVFGMAGADAPIAEVAFNIPLLICDSLSFLIDGVLLGLLYKNLSYHTLLEGKLSIINQNCKCPNIKCPNHGNCKDCRKYHHKYLHTYCSARKLEKFLRKIHAKIMN